VTLLQKWDCLLEIRLMRLQQKWCRDRDGTEKEMKLGPVGEMWGKKNLTVTESKYLLTCQLVYL